MITYTLTKTSFDFNWTISKLFCKCNTKFSNHNTQSQQLKYLKKRKIDRTKKGNLCILRPEFARTYPKYCIEQLAKESTVKIACCAICTHNYGDDDDDVDGGGEYNMRLGKNIKCDAAQHTHTHTHPYIHTYIVHAEKRSTCIFNTRRTLCISSIVKNKWKATATMTRKRLLFFHDFFKNATATAVIIENRICLFIRTWNVHGCVRMCVCVCARTLWHDEHEKAWVCMSMYLVSM